MDHGLPTTCPACHQEIPSGANFCPLCGARIGRVCAACGTAAETGHAFCLNCGAPLSSTTAKPAIATAETGTAPEPGAERRLVSILFVDLVGFTTLSEHRDAEEVRELLTRYFDNARTVISRYGGTVEKFIGDAVMAVWGAPAAKEDDAERAVRAGLDLVAAVALLGAEVGSDQLRARAGIVTGEAAVTIGAVGQGMVAGDAVNTASRVQSAAEPGAVLVDDVTRRATESAVTYQDAGIHTLKGKAEDAQLWRATRVVATVRGSQRGSGLEAPFVGRDRELRLVKDLFHATVEEGRSRLVSISGMAGIGKSRLAWEFEKYVDGIADRILWHRGRCLSYGDGVTYWALAEMVRSRAGIVEAETPASAAEKLAACLEDYIADGEERAWLEPRLANLLGLEDRANTDRIDLFAAWRVFFERLTERQPTILVFEEMQWADSGLVEFVEYLLEWSRHNPLFVVTLSRPDFADRFPSWGAGKRSFHSLYLEPLPAAAMDDLLIGLVPGLPDELRRRVRERAEGIPLYAVETVRMLLDRGTLRRQGATYVLTGAVGDLAVPETLHALIAARLDSLQEAEREIIQSGAVLGQSFTLARLAALAGKHEDDVRQLLEGLVRKELLEVQADPRSPERGQYAFLQALVQKVAYETLSRRERRSRHLAAARLLEQGWGGETDEIVEVVASHYLEAYNANPSDDDAEAVKHDARRMLERAAQRAASLGAADEAARYSVQAAALTDEGPARARLLEHAGIMSTQAGRLSDAIAHFETAIDLFAAADDSHSAAGVTARLGGVMLTSGHSREAIERLAAAYDVLRNEEPDADFGAVAAQMARVHFFLGERDRVAEAIEVALDIAEGLRLPELLCESLNTKSFVASYRGHHTESIALLSHALSIALERQLYPQALRTYYNLVAEHMLADRFEEALRYAEEGLALARRRGDRFNEWMFLGTQLDVLHCLGRWDEVVARAAELPAPDELRSNHLVMATLLTFVFVHVARGDLPPAEALLAGSVELRGSDDVQTSFSYALAEAATLLAQGRDREALAASAPLVEQFLIEGTITAEGFSVACRAALALNDLNEVRRLVQTVGDKPPQMTSDRVRGTLDLLRAHLAAAEGDAAAAQAAFSSAENVFAGIGMPYELARSQLEHAEWLARSEGDAEAARLLLQLAEPVLERLGARPCLERLAQVRATINAGRHIAVQA